MIKLHSIKVCVTPTGSKFKPGKEFSEAVSDDFLKVNLQSKGRNQHELINKVNNVLEKESNFAKKDRSCIPMSKMCVDKRLVNRNHCERLDKLNLKIRKSSLSKRYDYQEKVSIQRYC